MKKDLSVVIVSYNTKDLTLQCISRLQTALSQGSLTAEIIIIDNNSQDGSSEELKKIKDSERIKVVCNTENNGYGKANNQGLALAEGRYILYLNSDVLVPEQPLFDYLVDEMDGHPLYGGLTVRVELAPGEIDQASHRGFPTVWRSLCYYIGAEKITAKIPILNKIFGGYHLTYLSCATKHEIDSPTGAFFLIRGNLLTVLNGFDEDFFMYGEDIDLAFRIKRLGYSILYDPTYTVLHLKGQSGIYKTSDVSIQKKTRTYFFDSMAIFYKKHYENSYPRFISSFVYAVINRKKTLL